MAPGRYIANTGITWRSTRSFPSDATRDAIGCVEIDVTWHPIGSLEIDIMCYLIGSLEIDVLFYRYLYRKS